MRLVELGYPVRMVIDDLAGNRNLHGIPTYGILPRPVWIASQFDSDTWSPEGKTQEEQIKAFRNSWKGKLLRILRRVYLLLRLKP